ncbi:MAG: CotH kinase family protein [Prevotella sp.]|nr:CotH kinase family protein [Bacteroides sp.]MCM1366509.1 CotH kinase family protein [Prevotella sp.]
MKYKYKLFYSILLLVFTHVITLGADTLDADGYPLMYIRGTQTSWAANDSYRFNRTDNKYTITLPNLNGEFKIGGDDWEYDYGGFAKGVKPLMQISTSSIVNAKKAGDNIVASGLSDVTISFTLDINDLEKDITVKFDISDSNLQQNISGTLPVLYINVKNDDGTLNNEIIDINLSHKNYMSGEYWLDLNGCKWLENMGATQIGSSEEPLPLEIKARGNFTRTGFAKKPFKLKLKSKKSLLGMSTSKHYAILAHADDGYGYMRNFTGFNLGKRIGLPWTPSQQPVEVVINGNYRGLYFLTESIRIESDRIDIEELEDNTTDPNLVSGGYLVELDNYDEDNQIIMKEESFVSGHILDRLRITWDTPEEYSDIMKKFITDQFSMINKAIGENNDDVWRYLDLDDAARYYIIEEIVSHTESYHGSTYLFRDRGEGQKWHFSPLWDFGNAFSGPTDGFFYNNDPYGNTWIPSMRENNTFNKKVEETWLWFMYNNFNGIYEDLEEYVSHIAQAAKYDRMRWKDAPTPNGGMPIYDNSDIESKLQKVKEKLNKKVEWLKGKFGDFESAAVTTEPSRDTTEAAPLPDYLSSGIANIATGNIENIEPQYFSLQGIKVTTPIPGNIYIIKMGTKTFKQIYF